VRYGLAITGKAPRQELQMECIAKGLRGAEMKESGRVQWERNEAAMKSREV